MPPYKRSIAICEDDPVTGGGECGGTTTVRESKIRTNYEIVISSTLIRAGHVYLRTERVALHPARPQASLRLSEILLR